ncbi:MAG TPA: Calx-beta domain-containing protein [Candidatus Thermoplasmatota archaeon]|nr:Calx-beta domain-containing protein [Candidatus Thermoplasmatota archaeon]
MNGQPFFCDPSQAPTRAKITPTDAAAGEPDGSATPDTAKFTVSITPSDRPQTRDLQVNFTLSGTATRDVDYQLDFPVGKTPHTILVKAGTTSAEFKITALPDAASDPGGTVTITLNDTDPQGSAYYLRDDDNRAATATIADHAPLRVEAIATDGSATEGDDTGTFTVIRNSVTTNKMVLQFALGGDAARGTDYVDPGSTVTIPAGAASATVTIATHQDTTQEGTETVTLTLAGTPPSGHTFGGPATLVIIDDDVPSVKVTPTATQVTEGAAPGSSPGFRFERSSSQGELTAQYTVSGSAIADVDYAALPGEVTFQAGEAVRTVPLAALQDSVAEPVETVTVQIAAGGNTFVSGLPTQATISIIDDDQPTVAITVAREDAFENRDGVPVLASFNLTRSAAGLAGPLTVQLAPGGTASSGADYIAIPSSVTFPPGKATAVLNVTPMDDKVAEVTETVTVTLLSGPYAILAPGSGQAFIRDDDGVPTGQDGDTVAAANDNCPSATNQDQTDADGDGQGDACDADDDNDGLSDDDERRHGTSPTNADTDGDGLSDEAEVAAETDPLDRFSPDYRARDVTASVAGKGVTVAWEAPPAGRADRFQVWRLSEPTLLAVVPAVPGKVLYAYNDTGFPGGSHTYYVQAKLPGEGDVLFDAAAATGSPALDVDLCEVQTADQDGDGLCDALEQVLGTSPYSADTDGDGGNDAEEVAASTDPLTAPGDAASEGAKPFDEPLLWLGLGLLALLVAGAIVGLVLFVRRPA